MNKTLEKLYALRSQMSAAELPLDAIDEKIRVEEEKASSWKKDLDEITSTMKTFIQPIIKKWEDDTVILHAKFKNAELSTLLLNRDGKDIVLCQDPEDEAFPAPHSKRMKEALKVAFPDGMEIFEPQASVTLAKAIEVIGPERVEPLQIQGLISRNPHEFKASQTVGDSYYVNTHSNTNTKRKHLEEISRLLDLGLIVKVVPGVYKSRKQRPLSSPKRPSHVAIQQLLEELEEGILSISPSFSVNKGLKSYWQFTCNSAYVANAIPRKKRVRVMLNDEYDRLKGQEGVIDAPDAHYGHMNRYFDVYDRDGVVTVVKYITKMMKAPESSDIPNKIRIRLDKTATD